MATMIAAQVRAPCLPLNLVEVENPEPKEDEVRLKVEACSMCHGDAVMHKGYYPIIVMREFPSSKRISCATRLRSPNHLLAGHCASGGMPMISPITTGLK